MGFNPFGKSPFFWSGFTGVSHAITTTIACYFQRHIFLPWGWWTWITWAVPLVRGCTRHFKWARKRKRAVEEQHVGFFFKHFYQPGTFSLSRFRLWLNFIVLAWNRQGFFINDSLYLKFELRLEKLTTFFPASTRNLNAKLGPQQNFLTAQTTDPCKPFFSTNN